MQISHRRTCNHETYDRFAMNKAKAMSKVKLTSASLTSSGVEIGIKGKFKPGKLKADYFSITDENGRKL